MNGIALVGIVLAEEFDENQVTPGVWGFVATIAVMAIVVLLILDMVRRIRRVNYRAEAQARLDAEERGEAEATDGPAENEPGDEASGR